jgi:hypothetical protein
VQDQPTIGDEAGAAGADGTISKGSCERLHDDITSRAERRYALLSVARPTRILAAGSCPIGPGVDPWQARCARRRALPYEH